MIESFFVQTQVIARLRQGPLGLYLEALARTLHERGYARETIRGYLWSCDKFGRWLLQQGYPVTELDETLVARYISGLKRNPCGTLAKPAEGLAHLLSLLREQGVVATDKPATPTTEADQWLARYERYLDQVIGLAASTRQRYVPFAKRFMVGCFGSGQLTWSTLQAEDVAAFVRQEVATTTGKGRKMPAVAMRALLRYLVAAGELRPGLEATIPPQRHRPQAALPKPLSAEEVAQVLAVSKTHPATALRDHAILLLLARLGLRAKEVADLRLEDINWHEGRLLIRPGKGHCERGLPLAREVGSALAAYLTQSRPTSASRSVFLNHRAPFWPFQGAGAISKIAKRALLRAGLPTAPRLGAHIFRHTLASQMVCRGASFKEVADVLGHRSLGATAIYAQLDLQTLKPIALPWPGGAS